jgi:hypothetical protein
MKSEGLGALSLSLFILKEEEELVEEGAEARWSCTQNRGVCKKHGAKVYLCNIEGCTTQAYAGGVCVWHGAKHARKTVAVEDVKIKL